MMKYCIYNYEKQCFMPVKGHKIVIKGYEEYEFFIHFSISQTGVYCVSEKTTGTRICHGFTAREAIENTRARLDEESKVSIQNAINKTLIKTGYSPLMCEVIHENRNEI